MNRFANSDTTLLDRVYMNVDNLITLMKAKGKRVYTDSETGLKISYEDLRLAKQALQDALYTSSEVGYNGGSPMHKLKADEDAAIKAGKITRTMSDDVRAETLKGNNIKVVDVDYEKVSQLEGVDLDEIQGMTVKDATPILQKIAEVFGVVGRNYSNADIELDF